ncbi:MAG: DUF3488 and transglutaminase-like domain-containing protein [Sideroxydans sp.]
MKLNAALTYGLIACTLLVAAPHADHLPPWVSAICALLLGWRALLTWRDWPLPPRWLLLLITLASVAGIALTFRTLFGREAGVTLLILLTSLKLMELRTARDATVLIYLFCFIIITNFFYSQSLPIALFMFASLLLILATWLQVQAATLALRARLRFSALLLAQAMPLALLLFVLFPRVQGPLWGMPQDAYASSGLSDSMSPGSMSKLSLNDAVAFRATFDGTPPPRQRMYWRGPVLWDFDGTTWRRGEPGSARAPTLEAGTQTADYSVTLEPHNKRWLFALDLPQHISITAELAPDFQLLSREAVNARLRYRATSVLDYRANRDESLQQLRRALALPRGYNPAARQLAQDWQRELRDPVKVVQRALTYFNREGFRYTLEPPLLGTHSVDDFLFHTRQGFCEHYAGSFVFLMRAAGVPARVVTGYQGGEYNALGGYYIVRQSDAHAWAEVWLPGRGWVRYDPTAAISPARIERGLAAAVPDSAALPFMARNPPAWLHNLRLNWDALTNQWNQWVLGYNSERQFAFLTRLGMEDITWQKLALDMLAGLALLVGLISLLLLRRLITRSHDPVQQAWLKLCRKLARAGLPRAAHEGPLDYATRIAAARPQIASPLLQLTRQYLALRYGRQQEVAAQQAFRRGVRAFRL